ncbi:MAG: PaaI family thioesterase [Dermatophilaceae bacterium]
MPPTVRHPDYAAKVRTSFASQGLMAHFGAALTRVEPGAVDIEVGFREELSQQHDYFHAAVTTAIVDSSCGYAALTLMGAEAEVLTVELKINLFAPAHGDRLLARGRVMRAGRTLTVCHGDAYAVDAATGTETQCATMLATMMRVELPGG